MYSIWIHSTMARSMSIWVNRLAPLTAQVPQSVMYLAMWPQAKNCAYMMHILMFVVMLECR